MDEPTTTSNRVDRSGGVYLKAYPGTSLMTSHDREFLNRVVTKIAEIDGGEIPSTRELRLLDRERRLREANREAAYARQQAMLAKEQRFHRRFRTHAPRRAGAEASRRSTRIEKSPCRSGAPS